MKLRQLQTHMMDYLLDSARGTTSEAGTRLADALADSSPPVGLGIYAHAYKARLIEVLANDHEKLYAFLGRDAFDKVAGRYVVDYPSRYRSLRHFGNDFPNFLITSNVEDAVLCAELCVFERMLLDVYDAEDAELLQVSALSVLEASQWPGLTLTRHPSVRRFTDSAGAVPTWQQYHNGGGASAGNAAGPKELWLVWRDRARICQFRTLQKPEALAIDEMLFKGGSLATTAETIVGEVREQQLAPLLQGFLQRWFEDGLVQAVETGTLD